eukprot:gene7375-8195_t
MYSMPTSHSNYTAQELKAENVKLFEDSFNFADEEKHGFLGRKELKIALVAVFGYKPSKYELDNIMEKYGRKAELENAEKDDESLFLNLASYKQMLAEKMNTVDYDGEVRETFQMIDSNYKGFIDFQDFKKTVMKVVPNQNPVNMKKIFNEADRDCDGRVSYRDFQLLMQNRS